MVGTATPDRYSTRRDERVTYILRAPEKRHRFGISSLTVAKNELFTAGRDGTVRAWTLPSVSTLTASDTTPPPPKCTKTFDEHVDWVNDVLLVPGCERLISCSSDTTIKVWNANDPSRSLRTLVDHTDYVKALAYVPNAVASGSLDGRVLVWDLVTGRISVQCAAHVDDPPNRNGSVYCMTASIAGNILVSGSTDKTISVWDVRTGDRVVHLRSHLDSVRCLALKHDAVSMLSGATDGTVKLWDLRQERCIRSFDTFASSVWAVTANQQFDSFISGGRDGSVWHTDVTTDVATLVVPAADPDPRSNMVLDVALTSCNTGVWVSTTGSTVRLWPLPEQICPQLTGENHTALDASPNPNTTASKPRSDADIESPFSKTTATPLYIIPGLPGIIAHRIMNDRRHVMTRDTEDEFKIWDITRGVLDRSLGILEDVDIDDVLKQHDYEVSVPSWFQVDIRLGSLLVRLDKSSVANAEIYAVDAGLDAPTDDVKVNVGEHVIVGLFRRWVELHKRRTGVREEDDTDATGRSASATTQKNSGSRTPPLPPYAFPDHIPVVITEDRAPVPIMRRTVGGFQGNEESLLPKWALELVRDNKGQSREVVKISFCLEPGEGCDLPQLSTTTLNAPRVLRVRKVAAYIAKELKDGRATSGGFEIEASHLEVLCNGHALPATMSLATVRQFRWRSPDDLQLQFRLKAAA